MEIFIDVVERWGWREARRQLGRPRLTEDFRLASRYQQILDRLEDVPVFSALLMKPKVSLLDKRYWDQCYTPREDFIDERRRGLFASIRELERDKEERS